MKTFGIDVSTWQGANFDFQKAAAEGVKFAVIRGAYSAPNITGNAGKDTLFERHYNAAKAAGLAVGCYQYSMAQTVQQAKAEADFIYENVLKGKTFELPIYIDVEDATQKKLGKRLLTDIVGAWCERLESKGCFVGVYASRSFFETYLFDSELYKYTHWVAEWGTACNYANKNVLGMWQYGGETNKLRSNKVAGVTCDQNFMYVDFPTAIKAGGYNGYTANKKAEAKPQTKPLLKSTKTVANEVIAGKWGNGADREKRLTAAGYNYAEIQAIVNEHLKGIASKPTAATKPIATGDKVRLKANATVYGTQTRFAAFVYNTTLFVREINGDRVVISTQATGAVTGAVHIDHITRG